MQRQSGFSLIELMITLVLGLLVSAAVISLFASTSASNAQTLKMTHLNQELRAAMTLMVRDLRRAGYWADAGTVSDANPFDGITVNGACILFRYDLDSNGSVSAAEESFGYRLNTTDNTLEMRQNGTDDCSDANWAALTNENSIEVSSLAFDMIENTVSSAVEGLPDVTIRTVEIHLEGQLASDNQVQRTLESRVRVRNDAEN